MIWGHQEAELTETDSLWPKHGIAFCLSPGTGAGGVCSCKQSLSSSSSRSHRTSEAGEKMPDYFSQIETGGGE